MQKTIAPQQKDFQSKIPKLKALIFFLYQGQIYILFYNIVELLFKKITKYNAKFTFQRYIIRI